MAEADARKFASPFAIFRANKATDYAADGPMYVDQTGPGNLEVSGELHEAGFSEGSQVKLLYSRPGMSLTYAWFKSGFPLPRHSHNADCLYFIVAGSLKIGVEELGPGDGFFLGVNVPYTYVPGEQGVEVLEFRSSDKFDFKDLGMTAAWMGKALETLAERRGKWADEGPPSGMKVG
ncbi:MAG: cupin domain-containing protein [Novosphingobium sp.]